ncbi:MAG: type IV secretion system protein [Erythrobacter sp.]
MTAQPDIDPSQITVADTWGESVTADLERSSRRAWIVAIIAALIALAEAVALVFLIPLKTVEPYTLLVDRQTGNVEALAPLDTQLVAPDTALTRSFLVQYIIARESFSLDALQDDYRKVSLWSAGQERQRYQRRMDAGNPASPLAYLSRGATLRTEVKSISSLAENRSLVRFTTTRNNPGATPQQAQHWAAVVSFEFSSAEMSEADRLINPLGFQVTRYRRDAENLPEAGIVNGVEQIQPSEVDL